MKRAIAAILLLACVCIAGFMYATGRLTTVAAGLSNPAKAAANKHSKSAKQNRTKPPLVSVIAVNRQPFIETAFVTGTVVAREEVLVAPEISGQRILQVLVEEGDAVKKGQVLAHLVTSNLDAQMAQNNATQARAKAGVAQSKSLIEQAKATLVQMEASLKRARPLKRAGHLSQSTFDERLAAARTARAGLVSAQDGLRVAEAEAAQAKAKHRELAWRLGNTDVTAPTAGIISRRNAKIGALARAVDKPMFRIIQNGELELIGELTSDQLAKVRNGQSAAIMIAGVGTVPGKIRLISPEIDQKTRLGHVRISLPSQPGIRVGAFGRGHITTARSSGLSAPRNAVMYDGNRPNVLIVVNGIVKRRIIALGLETTDRIEVRSGLREGDKIIAKAGTFLRSGDHVRPYLHKPTRLSEVK